ncbi:MAG: STAS domain-containing protein [Phaeodactylibacter sp.]|nr:STAS domain-containing protein [Phaeodactylibacter sp.]MCB9292655.1 STAS domain-containing protein [Lewinellaceae bacterium]
MKYSIDKKEKYTVFQLEEDNLNSLIAPKLKSEFVILSNEGVSNLIFDLADVKFVDSSGLSAILTANRLWKSLGTFVLTGVEHPSVKKLIEISRLDTVLKIVPTVEESIEFIFMEELERELNDEGSAEEFNDEEVEQ